MSHPAGLDILFSKTDALGDQLWATGTVCTLLERLPKAHVLWIVRKGNEAIAALLPGSHVFCPDRSKPPSEEAARLGKVAAHGPEMPWGRVTFLPTELDAYALHPVARDWTADVRWWMEFVRALQIDCAIAGTVTANWVDQALVFASGASRRIGYELSQEGQELPQIFISLLHAQGLAAAFTDLLPVIAERHEGLNLAQLAKPVTGNVGCARIKIPLLPAWIPKFGQRGPIILAPGAGNPNRVYPPAQLAEALALASKSNELKARELIVLLGPQDTEAGQHLSSALAERGVSFRVVELSASELPKAATLISGAGILVCNESFWVHLASALGTPTVAIWGLGHWARFTPKQGHITVLHTDMLCQHCNWNCCFPRWRCVTDLPAEILADAVLCRLKKSKQVDIVFEKWKPSAKPTEIREALRMHARRAAADSQKHIDTLKSQLDSTVADNQKVIDSLRAQIDGLATTTIEQNGYISVLETTRNRLAGEVDAARAETRQATAESQKHIDALRAQLDHSAANSQKVIDSLKAQLDRTAAENQKVIDELRAQLDGDAATARKQTDYITVLERERDQFAEIERQSNTKAAHYIAVIEEQNTYIKTLETERLSGRSSA